MRGENKRADRAEMGGESDEDIPALAHRSHAAPPARLRTINDLDGRTRAAKLATRLLAALENDLGGNPSAAQRELAKRAALLGAITEDFEARWLEKEPADLGTYGMLVDRQRRCLEALGLVRIPRDITPPGPTATAIGHRILDAAASR